jgi:5-methylcytosine-specific restriction endonuclease McrA
MPKAQPVPAEAKTEPLWLLKSLPYRDYSQTVWWRRRRDAYIAARAELPGSKRCELCGAVTPNKTGIGLRYHVHHISYERLGQEHDDDLRLLCSPCHNLVHYPDSNAARHWASLPRHVDRGLALRARALHPGVDAALEEAMSA